MLNKNNFDVIIVGGGPAGATAAYLLKQQNQDVLIIDKDEFPRIKLCGGLLTYKTLRILNEIYGDTIQTLKDKGVIDYISHSYELRTKDEIWNTGNSAIPSVIVNRYVYDNYLLNRSLDIGAQILYKDRVIKVDTRNNIITTISGKRLKAKIIIGADGANSIVRKAMNKSIYDPKKWIKGLATGLEVTIPRADIGLDVSGPIIFFDIVPWGYGWVFPNNKSLVVGIGCLFSKKQNLSNALDSLLSIIQYKGENPKKQGHPIPYGNFLKRPANGNILLIGDAAGLVDPLMGEGIYYAHKSAKIAAESINYVLPTKSKETLSTIYIQSVQKNILNELSNIKKIRWVIFSMMGIFGVRSLKLIIYIIGIQKFIELVHGIRSYDWKKGQKI